jgi:hypothetical protein
VTAAKKMAAMRKASTHARRLTRGEQRALASFLAGRLPAGQLNDELCRAREAALAEAEAQQASAGVGAAALHAA